MTIKPEVIYHKEHGLISQDRVKKMLGIKHPNTLIKDRKILNLKHTTFTWGEVKQLLGLRLFLSKGKSGVFGRELYLKLLENHSPQTIMSSIGIDLEQEFQQLKKQWNYKN